LRFKCILNGCSTRIKTQAEELNGFIAAFLEPYAGNGSTLLFYAGKEKPDGLLDLAPTKQAELVRIDRYQPEKILEALERIEDHGDTDLYLFTSGFAGSELAVRWAFRRKGSSLVQVKAIDYREGRLSAKKTVYVDHVMATFRLDRRPFCLSFARGCVDRLPVKSQVAGKVVEYDFTDLKDDRFVDASQPIFSKQADPFENKKVLVVGGRGLQSRDEVQDLQNTADAMGAAFGISRPVALNAWGAMDRLIGVSGTIAKPELCIAAGVSGAAAFYAGIENSKVIIAINTDPHARILRTADVVIIDDCKAVMAEVLKMYRLDAGSGPPE